MHWKLGKSTATIPNFVKCGLEILQGWHSTDLILQLNTDSHCQATESQFVFWGGDGYLKLKKCLFKRYCVVKAIQQVTVSAHK